MFLKKVSKQTRALQEYITSINTSHMDFHTFCEQHMEVLEQLSEDELRQQALITEWERRQNEAKVKQLQKEEMPTKNVKGDRKVVRTTYEVCAAHKIPDGLDLQDKSVVKSWHVRYGVLHINYVDGRQYALESVYDIDSDYKYGESEIIDADDECVEYEEDEDQ